MIPTNSPDWRKMLPILARQFLFWVPIVLGLIHQFLMLILNNPPGEPKRGDGIYVFVKPPEYIYPFVSLEYQWWIVLLLVSIIMFVLAYSNRVGSIPSRFTVPFYAYILFLLILVKPV
ncbi:MAG: hypothetical protein JW953_15600 [Anaerolineae bacterium]|nr:hypothetical protein [Anaerolineae bacterium]